jgi:hypothetical protein
VTISFSRSTLLYGLRSVTAIWDENRYGPGGNVKVKVKFSLFLTKHHAMKMYWRVEV